MSHDEQADIALAPYADSWSAALDALRARLGEMAERASARSVDTAPRMAAEMAPALVRAVQNEPRFAWLCETFGLDALDAAIVVIAAAPDLDDRFAWRYADAQRRPEATRATGALCLRILSDDPTERLRLHERFAAARPLIRQRVLIAHDGASRSADPWRAGGLVVDPQILRTLFYDDAFDARVATYARLHLPSTPVGVVAQADSLWQGVLTQAAVAQQLQAPSKWLFRGPRGSGRAQAARALAAHLDMRLISADLAHLRGNQDFADLLTPLFREAWLREAVLYIEGVDALFDQGLAHEVELVLQNAHDDGGIVVLGTRAGWVPPSGRTGEFEILDFGDIDSSVRTQLWRQALSARGLRARRDTLAVLGERFRLIPAQIDAAAAGLTRDAAWRDGERVVDIDRLTRAARAQTPHDLVPLARKIEPASGWDDLVLPEDAMRQLRELCARVEQRTRVLGQWGFGAKLNLGKGTSALFAGASGTGKTMAAEVVARALGLDLYKIDLAAVVSKYIGETEKNLDRVFGAARNANAILLFDEADAIFGKRSEVRDAHDRYANLEIAYLLQKMEEYDGLAILSTNLKQNLDDAFLRRLTYTVLFPFPDVADRERIWRRIWPRATPLAPNIDFAALAARCKLSGGNIKNAALSAAYFAATEGVDVAMRHLLHAVRRELQKSGKSVAESEFADLLSPVPQVACAHG
jgi:ATP-dependent 26S proteasome regulatory subunit